MEIKRHLHTMIQTNRMRCPRERSCTLSSNLGQNDLLKTVVSAKNNINIYVFLNDDFGYVLVQTQTAS